MLKHRRPKKLKKIICIRNRNEDVLYNGQKLVIGEIYDGFFWKDGSGDKWCFIKNFDHSFATHWWFITLAEYRNGRINQILKDE